MLRAYFEEGSRPDNVREEEIDRRFDLFLRIMDHQGLDTLRILLPNSTLAKDLTSSIYSKIWAVPLEQVGKGRVWDSSNRRTRKQIGWSSMACDENEHLKQKSRR